jgi:hypothetical protein
MKSNKLQMLTLLGATLLTASVAMAGGPKVTCDQIQQALHSGKSQDQVAKGLKVSSATVKQCAAQKQAK